MGGWVDGIILHTSSSRRKSGTSSFLLMVWLGGSRACLLWWSWCGVGVLGECEEHRRKEGGDLAEGGLSALSARSQKQKNP